MSHPLPPKPSTTTTANAPTTRAPPPAPAPTPPTPVPTLIPPSFSPNSSVLLSGVALPPNPVVVCRAWTGPDDGIDAARKYIVDVAAGAPDVAAALAALVRPDAELSLWAFAIVSSDAAAPRLAALDFRSHGLKDNARVRSLRLGASVPLLKPVRPLAHPLCRMHQVSPAHDLPACSHRPKDQPASQTTSATSLRILARRPALARPGTDIPPALAPHTNWRARLPIRQPHWRMGDLTSLFMASTLTHAHVHISLAHPLPRPSTPTHILVHLSPQPTTLVPFPSVANPSPGTAVLLLPSSTPAYALAPYTGPAPHGFLSFLSGRGVQPSSATSPCILIWLPLPPNNQPNAVSPPNVNALPTPSATTPAATTTTAGTGARGMYVVWPRALCVVDTASPPIDVARLPNVPTTLMNSGSTIPAPTKPRRFPVKRPSIPRPITLTQPPLTSAPSAASSQAPTSAQPPSPTTSLSTLATSASTLIDTIVRAREKEKERQRARLERARSGSAVPIPAPSLSGASTPTTAASAVPPPPPPLHIQTQTQTPTGSALYPSPLANTPHHLSPVTHTHPHVAGLGVGAAANMSPAQSEGFGIGTDLFGDQEGFGSDGAFAVGMDAFTNGATGGDAFGMGAAYTTNGPFGPGGGYDTATTSTLTGGTGAIGAGGGAERGFGVDLFGDLWADGTVGTGGGEDPKSGTLGQREDDEMGALAEAEFDFFDTWGGPTVPDTGAAAVAEFSNLDLGLDLGLDVQMQDPTTEVIDLDPTSPISSAPTSIPTPTPKPYFPLTPPADDGYRAGDGKKAGMFDPLRFTQKFEGVDSKYKGAEGKFVFRLGPTRVTNVGSTRTTDMGRIIRPNAPQIQLPPRSWSYAPVGQDTPGSTPGFVNTLDQLQIRSRNTSQAGYQAPPAPTLARSPHASFYAQSQPQAYAYSYPQFQRQLPTPTQSPNSLRRLRAGYIGLTNPSAKRIRSLRQAHTKTEAGAGTGTGTGTGSLSLFAKDWESSTRPPGSPTATLSDTDSDADSDDSDGGVSVAITIGGAAPSRGTSPPLSAITSNGSGTGVPPGPALLLAHFRASVLESGAVGEVLAWPEQKEPKTPAPVSVPTPVSPGGITELSKATVEAAANILAREAVDNWVWGAEVGAYTWNDVYAPNRAELVLLGTRLATIGSNMTLQRLITAPKVEVVSEVLTDRPYPHYTRFEKLRHPKLAVGHSGQVTQMSSSALRFWNTVGLEPVGGVKDVVAFAVFEGSGDVEEERMVERWLEKVAKVYESRKLGKHELGECENTKKGVVQVRWNSTTKTLPNLVFYIILPPSILPAPWFQSMLLKLKSDTLTDTAGQHITIHLVPATTVFNHNATPSDSHQQLESIALSLYDRIPRTVGKRIRREIIRLSFPVHTIVHVPAFTIARTLTPRFRFSMDWPDRQRETMDRHMFLHVAYGFSKSRRWLCAACVDERGEAYETKAWRVTAVPEEEPEGELEEEPVDRGARTNKYVNMVWHFAMKFAKRAGIEWRIVICRMGIMSVEELEAWNTCTSDNLHNVRSGIHVSVLSFDYSSGLTFAAGIAPSIKAPLAANGASPTPVIIDVSSNDFFILPVFDTDIRTNSSLEINTDDMS
ncbi:hypothetical protein FRC06_001023, partial [Ceratobasidium sp. 370]